MEPRASGIDCDIVSQPKALNMKAKETSKCVWQTVYIYIHSLKKKAVLRAGRKMKIRLERNLISGYTIDWAVFLEDLDFGSSCSGGY